MPPNNFNRILLAAVEESLSSLGVSSKDAILYHLESSFNMKRESIPANLTEFTKALEGIFGPGASYIEQLITQRLYEKLGMDSEHSLDEDFLKSVRRARQQILVEESYVAP